MNITSYTIKTITIPLQTPFVTALRRVENVEAIQLTLYTSEGNCGIGEAPATKAITSETLQSIELFLLQHLQEILEEQSFEGMLKKLHTFKANNSAKTCIEIALYNLFNNFPSVTTTSQSITTAITISLNSLEEMVRDAKKAYEAGFDILKVKVDNTRVIEKVEAIQKAVEHATILIDANQSWSLEESLQYIKSLHNIALIEQPVIASDIKALKTISEHSTIPILADEAVFTLQDAQQIVEGSYADMINIKLMKCGGISKAIEILEYCRTNNVTVMLGSMLETPESIKAALKLSVLYQDVILYNDLDSPFLYTTLPSGFLAKKNKLFLA